MKISSILLCFILLSSLPLTYAEDTWTTIQPSYREVSFVGFSRARYSMTLSTEVAGKVDKVFVDVGDVIQKNENVSCLDDTFTKIDLNSTKNDIAQAKIDVAYFKKQVARYSDLVKKKSVSLNQLDDMQRQFETAQRVEQSKKLLQRRQQETLSRHCIKAPIGWLVEERYVNSGQWVDVGEPIVKVGDYTKLLVPFTLLADELNALRKNKNLTVWLPDYNLNVSATLERVSPVFDESSRKIQVDLSLEKDIPAQRGGVRVSLKLKHPEQADLFSITSKALDKRFEEVWLQRKDGKALRVDVLNSLENEQVQIKSPELKAGDQFKIIQN